MKRGIKILAITVTFVASFGNISIAQTSPSQSSASYEKDAKVLSDFMGMNLYNLSLMRIIEQKSQNAELKDATTKMLPFYLAMDGQLRGYANKQNLNIEGDEKEKIISKLSKWDNKAPGAEWERDMAEELVDIHKDGIDMLKDAEMKVQHAELKQMVSLALQKMPSNLDMLTLIKEKTKKATPITDAVPSATIDVSTGVADELAIGNAKDAKFVSDMVNVNMFTAKLSELILKKGQDRDLKNVAQNLLEHHNRMSAEMKAYAMGKTYGLDADEVSKTNEKLAKWITKNGGMEWDADISEELKDIHKDAIDMMEDARKDVKDNALLEMINMQLPMLREHLVILTPMKDKVKKAYKTK